MRKKLALFAFLALCGVALAQQGEVIKSIGVSVITGLGTGVATALGNNTNASGGFPTQPVANGSLANSSITISGASTALGGSYSPARYGGRTSTSPTGTTSTTKVMAGLGTATNGTTAVITPTTSGNLFVTVSGIVSNSVAADGCALTAIYGTGAAPTNGTAVTGTGIGDAVSISPLSGTQTFVSQGYVAGLSVSTTYWIDVGFSAITGGTCTLSAVTIVALEE